MAENYKDLLKQSLSAKSFALRNTNRTKWIESIMGKSVFWRDVKENSLRDVFTLIMSFSSSDEEHRKKCRDRWKTEKQVTDASLISRTSGMETRWGWSRSSETARWKGGVRTTSQDAERIREVYDCISQGINQWPWSLAVSRDGKNLNSLNYLDRSRKTVPCTD